VCRWVGGVQPLRGAAFAGGQPFEGVGVRRGGSGFMIALKDEVVRHKRGALGRFSVSGGGVGGGGPSPSWPFLARLVAPEGLSMDR